MRNANLSSLNRSFIGFDRLLSNMSAHMNEQKCEKPVSYPPYNIESLAEDKYRITMAVAGFVEDEAPRRTAPEGVRMPRHDQARGRSVLDDLVVVLLTLLLLNFEGKPRAQNSLSI